MLVKALVFVGEASLLAGDGSRNVACEGFLVCWGLDRSCWSKRGIRDS